MRNCAYCGSTDQLTREHIFPDFLGRSYPTYRTYLDPERGKVPRRSPPTIRDVCRRCNNENLSLLDDYGRNLNQRYFSVLVDPPIDISFVYDFHLLLRWLLKLCYNEARTREVPTESYRQFIPYILGRIPAPPVPTFILLGIIASVQTTRRGSENGTGNLLRPQVHRFGDLQVPVMQDRVILARLVSFNSYFFGTLAWEEEVPLATIREVVQNIAG